MDPRIGILIRNGQTVYYAYPHGYNEPMVEGTLQTVEAALGLPVSDAPIRFRDVPVNTTPVGDPTFVAILYSPNGEHSGTYEVTARNKTEARKEIRKLYRIDTPAPRYGFYAFEDMRLVWVEDGN